MLGGCPSFFPAVYLTGPLPPGSSSRYRWACGFVPSTWMFWSCRLTIFHVTSSKDRYRYFATQLSISKAEPFQPEALTILQGWLFRRRSGVPGGTCRWRRCQRKNSLNMIVAVFLRGMPPLVHLLAGQAGCFRWAQARHEAWCHLHVL